MRRKTIFITFIAFIIGLGAGYVAAVSFKKADAVRTPSAGTGARFAHGTDQGTNEFLVGTITKKDSESITVTTRDGNLHLVLFTPDTSIFKSIAGSVANLTIDSTVTVSGSTNSDGSLSANSIQLSGTGTPTTLGR